MALHDISRTKPPGSVRLTFIPAGHERGEGRLRTGELADGTCHWPPLCLVAEQPRRRRRLRYGRGEGAVQRRPVAQLMRDPPLSPPTPGPFDRAPVASAGIVSGMAAASTVAA
jgi:hypothetical protein